MPNDAYETDILDWAEYQAALLRRVARGEQVNEAIDWPHIIEEVEDLGRAELHACESLLRQAMLHLLKLHTGADTPAAHWRAETVGFLADAAARFTPAMRQRIDLPRLYAIARRQAEAAGVTPQTPFPRECPWTLDGLLAQDTTIDTLLKALTP